MRLRRPVPAGWVLPALAKTVLLIGMALLPGTAWGTGDGSKDSGTSAEYRTLEALNAGLPSPGDPPDLETPQSTLENFLASCRAGRYERAAHALNLNAVAVGRQAEVG